MAYYTILRDIMNDVCICMSINMIVDSDDVDTVDWTLHFFFYDKNYFS